MPTLNRTFCLHCPVSGHPVFKHVLVSSLSQWIHNSTYDYLILSWFSLWYNVLLSSLTHSNTTDGEIAQPSSFCGHRLWLALELSDYTNASATLFCYFVPTILKPLALDCIFISIVSLLFLRFFLAFWRTLRTAFFIFLHDLTTQFGAEYCQVYEAV